MVVPRSEEFILDVRRAARLSQKPTATTDSYHGKPDAIAQVLQGAALWLTPKIVAKYHHGDFKASPEPMQNNLHQAVDAFRTVALGVTSDKPATQEQFTKGLEAFRRLISVVRSVVLADWETAAKQLIDQTEAWAADQKWQVRRETKKMEETILSEYELQQLLFYTAQHLYVLDPVARFVPGARGAFDLTLQPSYYVTSLYRYFDNQWYVHLDVNQGDKETGHVVWNKDLFIESVEELRSLV